VRLRTEDVSEIADTLVKEHTLFSHTRDYRITPSISLSARLRRSDDIRGFSCGKGS
jgi:hypothetical protein